MGKKTTPEKTAKFLAYVLGRHPDEFGLLPDENGWVKEKELIKTLSEEEGWKWFRKAHINEIRLVVPDPPIEIREKMIRAVERSHLPQPVPDMDPPGLLYCCVRKKAYPNLHGKQITPGAKQYIILSKAKDMAKRIGGRIDNHPVLLTVHSGKAMDLGTVFFKFGDHLYLAEFISSEAWTGPPLPKEAQEEHKSEKPEKKVPMFPGSYFPNILEKTDSRKELERKWKKKDIAIKKERREQRKKKDKMWKGEF